MNPNYNIISCFVEKNPKTTLKICVVLKQSPWFSTWSIFNFPILLSKKCFSTLPPLYLNNVNQNYDTFQNGEFTTHSKPQPCLLQTFLPIKYNDKPMKRHHILNHSKPQPSLLQTFLQSNTMTKLWIDTTYSNLEFSKKLKLSMMSFKTPFSHERITL